MKCLLCENILLERTEIDDNLHAFTCKECGGIWIQAKAYWKWLKSLDHPLPEKPESETAKLTVEERPQMKICIDCGHFLTRRKVGHGISFHIDRCQCCGGIWLDHNEWEILKSRNLHDDIHFIFGQEWQEDLQKEEREERYQQEVKSIIGDDVFAKVADFKDFLEKSPTKNIIMAYLQNA
jgi:Zn-finger nucleic acid-binding protein